MRASLSLFILLGLLMCGMSVLAAGPNGEETFLKKQEALSFVPDVVSCDRLRAPGETIGQSGETGSAAQGTTVGFSAARQAASPPITAVSTAQELGEWLSSLDGQGGEVVLEDSITLTETIWPQEDQSGPVVIHTGAFGLIYDGGYIDTMETVLIGDGVDLPVLEIRSTGEGYSWFAVPDWNNVLSMMEVTALGREGTGGVAVRVTADSETRTSTAGYETRGKIRSCGERAVGLQLPADELMEVYFLDVAVEGENACVVDAPSGTDLFGCVLSAKGDGAVLARGEGIVLDTCRLSSEPEGVTVIRRTIERRVGIDPQIQQNTDAYNASSEVCLYEKQRYLLSGDRYLDAYLGYDDEVVDNLDTSVPGKLDIPVSLPACMQGLGLEPPTGLTYRVWIRDPALPILELMRQEDDELIFFSWYGAVLEEGTILWCSEDDGVTWTDATGWEAVTWCEDSSSREVFLIEAAQIVRPIYLVLENSAGLGNVIYLVPGEENIVRVGTGGDRDGGDREEQPGGEGGQHFPGNPDGSSPDDPREEQPGGGDDGENTGGPNGNITAGGSSSSKNGTDERRQKRSDLRMPLRAEDDEPELAGPVSSKPEVDVSSPADEDETSCASFGVSSSGEAPAVSRAEQAPSSSAGASAPEREPESLEAGAALPSSARPARGAGWSLSVLVFLAAGGVSALAAFYKKRGGR